MLKSKTLEEKMNETEKEVWQAFRGVVDGFLTSKKDPIYKELVKKLIKSYQNMGCRMFVKLTFYAHIWISFKKILVTSVRSMVRDFTRILSQWKDDIRAAGRVQ